MHYIFIAWYLAATFAVSEAEPEIEIPTPPEGYFHVTLLAYSNLRDPVWKFGQCLNQDIQNLLLQAKNNSYVYEHVCIPKKTGFKGFLVQDGSGEQLIVGPETIELQLLLLDTMPNELPPIGDYRQRIRIVIASGTVSSDCPDTTGNKSYELPYSLKRWNFNENIRRKNNAYNYVNDLMSNSFAQPGRASGQIYSQISGDQIRDAAVRNGLVVLNPHPAANDSVPTNPGGDSYMVALFVSPGNCHMGGDFHWYRLDNNGTWSHKPGQTGATDLDDANRPITDPRTADTGAYKFVCFMMINETATVDTTGQLKQTPALNCRDLLWKKPSTRSGIYWIDPNGGLPNDAFQAYCDQTTHGGGWTLVWGYTFTAYAKYTDIENAVTPRPTWAAEEANTRVSNTVPLSETHNEAMDFALWRTIGEEVLIKSNINNWITCKDGTGKNIGSIVLQKGGTIKCKLVKQLLQVCGGKFPDLLVWLRSGPSLVGPDLHYYRFDCSTKTSWPTHDPCGDDQPNHLKGVANPHGNMFVR